ncbi:Globin-like domain and Globin, structural domain-containing protein [Strongyloides ratti]|uniref:Globin-like domain and Globin, structural domain-containing protein n=1 Tax=Strongyloides ratti TaxID=34506 RepID=A0A090L1U6_STRRB|nr:Globin-like domain and Globin, structural domain-containing protein [Strongyloides ratti]CEF63761.1 Globin-like domain and Globin, structural domain-containing protein [Strongyloides ratti]
MEKLLTSDDKKSQKNLNESSNIEMNEFNDLKINNDIRRLSESGFTKKEALNYKNTTIQPSKEVLSSDGIKNPKSYHKLLHSHHNVSLKVVGRSKTDPGERDLDLMYNDDNYIINDDIPSGSNVNFVHKTSGNVPYFSMTQKKIEGYNIGLRDKLDLNNKFLDPHMDLSINHPKTLSEQIGLSFYQQKLILQCWPNIYTTGVGSNFASNIYPTLCCKNSKAKALLQQADGVAVFSNSGVDCTTMHAKLTLEIMDSIIKNLDTNPLPIISYLQDTGYSHKSLKLQGMNMSMWDDLGDSILDGVRKNDLVRKHKELRRAWLAIIAFLIDNLKQGQNSFRSSPSITDIQLCSNINFSVSNNNS